MTVTHEGSGAGRGTPLAWDPETLWLALQPFAPKGYAGGGAPDGVAVEIVPEIDSTNSALLARARAGDLMPGVLVAERQTAGRGRLGRPWWSQAGDSLTFSIAWPLLPLRDGQVAPEAPMPDWSALSLAVGLAVAQALDPAGQVIGLKWPNDLWLRTDDRKLAGILIESLAVPAPADAPWAARLPVAAIPGSGTALPPTLRLAVIGIGINIAAEAPPGGEYRTGYVGLGGLAEPLDAPAALHRVVPAVLGALRQYAEAGFAPAARAAFAARDVLAGRVCTAGDARGQIEGRVEGVAEDGSLLMHTAAGVQRINSGEVSVRPC